MRKSKNLLNDNTKISHRLYNLRTKEGAQGEKGEKPLTQAEFYEQFKDFCIKNNMQPCGIDTYKNYEQAKNDCLPKIDFLICAAKFYNVSLDYLCALSDCTQVDNHYIGKTTGLSDKAIIVLKRWKKSKPELLNTFNLLFEYLKPFENLIAALKNLLSANYRIICYPAADQNKFMIPSEYVSIRKNDKDTLAQFLTLAKDRSNPDDTMRYIVTDDFFETIAQKQIDVAVHDLHTAFKHNK